VRFAAIPGATPPVSRAGVPLSEPYLSFAESGSDLEAYVAGEPTEVRAQCEVLVQARAEVRATSHLIGNLLGSLTVWVNGPVNGPDRFINPNLCFAIAQTLKELNMPPESGLYSLKGAKYCLDTYMAELSEIDICALSTGVLRSTPYCKAVLNMISPHEDDALRIWATTVLADIAEAVDRRVVRRDVHKPLLAALDLLNAPPVDARTLAGHLAVVSSNKDKLNFYFDRLSADELKNLRSIMLPESSDHAREILSRMTVHSPDDGFLMQKALPVLEWVREPFEAAYSDKAHEIIEEGWELVDLLDAMHWEDQSKVCTLLPHLSVGVTKALAFFGELPNYTIMDLKDWTRVIMDDVLRDYQNNPTGPLNWHSLRKLDDGMRKNLGDAAQVLWAFGLELDPALRAW